MLTNGHVVTLDAKSTEAQAVAVRGSRIIAIGTNGELASLAGAESRIIDVEGRAIIPGIIDAHAHMEREGLKSLRLSLTGAKSIADILGRISEAAGKTPKGEWIVTMPVGEPPHYYDELETIAERRMPTRQELDKAAPGHPVCIMAAFGFWGAPPCYWALNSQALALNGVTANTKPAFGTIVIEKDPGTGEPTGIIVENSPRPIAPFDILKAVPKFTYEERLAGLKESMRLYNAVGTTGIYEGHGSSPETIALYRDLSERNESTIRSRLTVSPTWRTLEQARDSICNDLAYARGNGLGDGWLRVSGVFIGLMGDTALRNKSIDALPDTGWSGFIEPATSYDEFSELAHLCAANDLRLHTIVSGRVDRVIPILEELDRTHSIKEKRWIIEHIDVVEPTHIEALKRLGVMVTSIPVSTIWQKGADMLDQPDNGNHVAPWRSLMEAGVPLAAGTDNIPYNPFYTLWVMMARHERLKSRVIGPDQRLTAEQGLRALTIEGARLSFEEIQRGSIETGKKADLAVLSADPMTVPVEEIKNIESELTVVGGRIVHEGL
ncbi:MAG: amidohydrolase [Rhodospirillaceae bacterium]|nr:amidohydrolase [Rhodospirillaceae bacterium]